MKFIFRLTPTHVPFIVWEHNESMFRLSDELLGKVFPFPTGYDVLIQFNFVCTKGRRMRKFFIFFLSKITLEMRNAIFAAIVVAAHN